MVWPKICSVWPLNLTTFWRLVCPTVWTMVCPKVCSVWPLILTTVWRMVWPAVWTMVWPKVCSVWPLILTMVWPRVSSVWPLVWTTVCPMVWTSLVSLANDVQSLLSLANGGQSLLGLANVYLWVLSVWPMPVLGMVGLVNTCHGSRTSSWVSNFYILNVKKFRKLIFVCLSVDRVLYPIVCSDYE